MEHFTPSSPPPNTAAETSIVHTIKRLYAEIYRLGTHLAKRDKLGIHTHIEKLTLEITGDIIRASLMKRTEKEHILVRTRLSLEILKHMIRTEHELQVIDQKAYIRLESLVIETSKMATGWLRYLKTKKPAKQQGFL